MALEGIEGTDAMLARVAALRAEGRISPRRKGVLVKLCKPQQDIRADLPTIGIETVENAKKPDWRASPSKPGGRWCSIVRRC